MGRETGMIIIIMIIIQVFIECPINQDCSEALYN